MNNIDFEIAEMTTRIDEFQKELDKKLLQIQILTNENSIEHQKLEDEINDLESENESLKLELKSVKESSDATISKLKEDHKKELDKKEGEMKDISKKTNGVIESLKEVVDRQKIQIDDENAKHKQLESEIAKLNKDKGNIISIYSYHIDSDTKVFKQEYDKLAKELEEAKSPSDFLSNNSINSVSDHKNLEDEVETQKKKENRLVVSYFYNLQV